MLTFDEPTHVYHWNGQRVPNVTSIIKPLSDYSFVDPDVLERARQEGVAVHKMSDLFDKGQLQHVPDWMHGHVTAYEKFIADCQYKALVSEQRLFHPLLRYAGTEDKIGMLYHPKLKREVCALIDIKRSFAAGRAIGVQLAAYVDQWHAMQMEPRVTHRFGLQLRADGTYRLREFADPQDRSIFLACLTMYRYNEKEAV